MRKIAAFIMAGRLQAVTSVVAFAVLSVVLPPFTLLSGAVVALVALRKGPVQALVVIGWATLLLSAFLGALGQFAFGLVYGLVQWLPVLPFALLLRRSVSWAVVMQALAVLGVVGVLLVHAIEPNIAQVWQEVLHAALGNTLQRIGMSAKESSATIGYMAQYFTGIFAMSFMLSISVSLVLGRAWQAQLYNPGGFREEFTAWRMHAALAGAMLVLAGLAVLLQKTLLIELMFVGLVPFLLQALGLVHGIVRQAGLNVGWLVGMYGLLVFASPYMPALLSAVGIADCFMDIRGRLAKRS